MLQQVDNLQKVSFVHHFIEKFDRFIYIAVLPCRISFKFFDEMVNRLLTWEY